MPNVYLIGAGPGDPGLLTVKAKQVLETADVVIYDYLANPVFLDLCREDAEIFYVGKKGGDHTLPQDKINDLIVRVAAEGKMVARLKGGDPFVFGRGGEEAEEIVAAGLTFEVIPGVTAGVAAPAYAGIPVTHREHTTSVCFITGHEDPTKETSGHNWDVYAKSNSTLVFYMGVKNLPMIADSLMSHGRSADTPVALVYRGTSCRQRTLVSTLANVAAEAEAAKFEAPSIIVVGTVCSLAEKLRWFDDKPLLGKGVVVTRAREQASGFADLLGDMGACVHQFPTIKVNPLADYSAVKQSIEKISEYDWLVFTSVNGVRHFWAVLDQMGLDTRALGGRRVAAIGPATADLLAEHGVRPDFVPDKYVAESVVAGLLERGVAKGSRVLIPRARVAREVLPEELRRAGAEVTVLPVYETSLAEAEREDMASAVRAALEAGEIRYVTFTSSSTVENFFAMVAPEELRTYANVRLASIGPVTARTLEGFGFTAHVQPGEFTIPALAQALAEDAGK